MNENEKALKDEHLKRGVSTEVLDEAAIKQSIEDNAPRKHGILRTVFFDFGRKTQYQSMKLNFLPHWSNVKAFLSPICPDCGTSILMYDSRIPRSYKGNVNWACGNLDCNFELVGPKSFRKIKQQIGSTFFEFGQDRLANISDADRDKLITGHLSKAKLFLGITVFMGVYLIYIYTHAATIWPCLPVILLATFFYIQSITYAYRAWQICTGMLFLPSNPFLAWYRYAPSKYNLDWYNGYNPLPENILEQLQNDFEELRQKEGGDV